jgi:hypothetical protein
MKPSTKRMIIGAAALATAGLFGSLPYEGSSVAQQGVPTVHRDVALVDSVLLGEVTYDNGIYTDVVSPNGFEDTLFISYGAHAPAYLDTGGTGAIFDPTNVPSLEYLNDFDGSLTQLYDGYLADTVATEDEVNGLLGVQAADQAGLLATFDKDYIGALPTGDAAPVVGSASFDSALATIATSNDMAASSDFATYGEYFLTNLSAFTTDGLFTTSGLETTVADFTTGLDGLVTNLGTDLTALLGDLGGAF